MGMKLAFFSLEAEVRHRRVDAMEERIQSSIGIFDAQPENSRVALIWKATCSRIPDGKWRVRLADLCKFVSDCGNEL